ncbi:hypothetical protein [Streptomyces sp. NPDC056160]|uniref:hypothetical protein n=1 Tax=Streptomyces sp. NPDC056160 TaxID=3345731 RepID=UPI0035D97585
MAQSATLRPLARGTPAPPPGAGVPRAPPRSILTALWSWNDLMYPLVIGIDPQ